MSNLQGMTRERYEEVKKEVIESILKFCASELNSENLDSDQKESLMVAKQCLEAAYEYEDSSTENATDLLKLFNTNNIPIPAADATELESEAEEYKVKGNDAMKDNNYSLAIEHYTKAIQLYNRKAIYYCNRAAAYSRMERHHDAIADCKEAIKLDPTYGKAYGRLGIAYANMNMYREAADSYRKALELDPNNASYESNLRLAEEKIVPSMGGPDLGGFDFGGIMNNPALLNMASQMLNDPSFRNVVSGIMSNSGASMDSFVEAGQQFAEQMNQTNPGFIDNMRQTMYRVRQQGDPDAPNQDTTNNSNTQNSNENNDSSNN